jgi:hypothetical protein
MKNALFTTVLMLLSFFLNAQNTTTKTSAAPLVQFGLKAGLNLANLSTDLLPNSDYKTAYHIGGLAHIHLSPHFALQPELVYSRQGAEINSSTVEEWDVDYINVPLMVQYMNRGLRLETGPQIGFVVNAEREFTSGNENDGLQDQLKTTDFSWGVGISYLSLINLGIGVRYNYGISNINEDIVITGVRNNEINNRVFQFSVFYQFR